ncbi:hypothetical protein [Burkholderia cepacia]|uniref:hypothetical protein n=1 Tax=Burkholderia cepacia TaxID=292 RepID=UPI000A5F2E32|nr:hypothetical protein [Burkholderia cepacia]
MDAQEQPIEGLSREELIAMERSLGGRVSQYSTALTIILPGDSREPPGDLHGSGAFVEFAGMRFVLTCEHVASGMARGQLLAGFDGAEIAFTLNNPFAALTYPVDVALTAITENTWRLAEHTAKAIPAALFARRHQPVAGELMYVAGVPGESARTWPPVPSEDEDEPAEPGVFFYTLNAFMCEITEEFDAVLSEERPRPLQAIHFLLPYTPEHAVYMNDEGGDVLPRAPGLSGSLVWNTRYREVTALGKVWEPEDARVTGIVWGNSTKAGVLVATPIEHCWRLIDHVETCVASGKPYWTPLASFVVE